MPFPCTASSARGDLSTGITLPLREIWSLAQWNIYGVWSVVFLDIALYRGLNRSRRFDERNAIIFKVWEQYIHSELYDLSSRSDLAHIQVVWKYCQNFTSSQQDEGENYKVRSFVICTCHHTLHCFPNRVQKGVMGEAYRIHAGDSECIQNFIEF
jgi:hypothetical protein